MNHRNFRVACIFALLVALGACSRDSQSEASIAAAGTAAPQSTAGAPPPPPRAPMEEAAAADADAGLDAVQREGVDANQLVSGALSSTDPQRRFVRTADASFQVDDVYAATLAVEDAVAAAGGFVARNDVSTTVVRQHSRPIGDGRRLQLSQVATQGSLVIRVPSERMQTFLRTIAKRMRFLDARSFEANDVQFDLLRRELALRRARELQQDARAAAAQAGRTGEKIDAMEVRERVLAARDEAIVARRELEDRITFGTITLALREPPKVREQVVPDTDAILRERGPGFFAEAGQAARAGWRGLLAMLVVLVGLWPLWLCVAACVLAFVYWRRRKVHAAPRVDATPT
ncbi:MAG TPA: DUF4349 domain-containing protein [Xanthomonadaceae bacterium]|nr:DUF4349 domain-containing protein [Xanthomonadaceae bacterium]